MLVHSFGTHLQYTLWQSSTVRAGGVHAYISMAASTLQKCQRINIHTDARCLELLAVLVRFSQSVLETLVQGATRSGFQQYVPAIAVVEFG